MKKTTLLAMTALVAALFPAPRALAAPSIEFLNPSGYSTQATLSDVGDRDGFYHLVAWGREVPSSALVEFELKPPGQNAATFTGERVGNDTWEFFLPIPDTYTDTTGYTLTARLYRGVPGDADEVANASMTVEIDQSNVPPPTGETVELTYPSNGGPLGVFQPKGKRAVTVFDYKASADTNQVRAFYTTAGVGTVPAWGDESCGASTPDEQGFGKVRCTLKEGHNPLAITAVALVSNKTAPPAPPSAALDDTGDAHRVIPYLQEPRSIDISDGQKTVPLAACHYMTAFVNDQFDRAVPSANVDVHADGPEDELFFGLGPTSNPTDAYQAPDNQHVSKETTHRCDNNENSGQQGDHNSPGRDDAKHIESVAGTKDNGSFRFALRSDFAGGTFITAWADVNDDDLAGLSEASGGTQIGWGSPPPPPSFDLFLTPASSNGTTGSCVPMEVLARRGGSPYANGNVDVHLSGPDAAVNFCDVSGGGARRPPESGGHVGDAHDDGTRHGEGETDADGRFVFGLTSPSSGTTQVEAWIDSTDDDLLSAEPSKTATVTWQPPGDRSISISSSKASVRKGRRVALSGQIEGDPSCSDGQTVNIQSKPLRGGRFGTAKIVTTNDDGFYSTKIKMRSSRKFRAVAPAVGTCSDARSRTITVRTR